MTLAVMSVTSETNKYTCEFCNKDFVRESSFLKHICTYKHRWLDRDGKGNRIGFQAWLEFYSKTSMSTKQRTYGDFIRSPYYNAFIKFGNYCADINALNVSRFIDWLLKNQIKLDTWNTDTVYNKFLVNYLKEEDPYDAISRSIRTCFDLASEKNIQGNDCLRYLNKNIICINIVNGKISPWLLFQSNSGIKFLESLDPSQVKMVIDYINPEQWAIKFKRNESLTNEINHLLKTAGF